AELQGVVADVPGRGTEGGVGGGLDLVAVAELVGAEVQVRRGGAGVAEGDDHLRQARVHRAQRVVGAAADLELGGQVLVPVAEQLHHRGLHFLGDVVPAAV